jgi:acyl-CoA synthetase (AMP-forming)/AMP-acid ligase II
LFVTGRKKDVLIVNGKNFSAHDVEFLVNTLAEIKKGRLVAVGVYSERVGSEEVVIIAESPQTSPQSRQEIKRAAKALLMQELDLCVRDVYVVPPGWIVKTTSGKISRAENRQKYLEETQAAAAQRLSA